MSALTKVDTPLSERYMIECARCQYPRQVFGTETEARKSAVAMGWEFRKTSVQSEPTTVRQTEYRIESFRFIEIREVALCPH